jgi:hypothetical protein
LRVNQMPRMGDLPSQGDYGFPVSYGPVMLPQSGWPLFQSSRWGESFNTLTADMSLFPNAEGYTIPPMSTGAVPPAQHYTGTATPTTNFGLPSETNDPEQHPLSLGEYKPTSRGSCFQ